MGQPSTVGRIAYRPDLESRDPPHVSPGRGLFRGVSSTGEFGWGYIRKGLNRERELCGEDHLLGEDRSQATLLGRCRSQLEGDVSEQEDREECTLGGRAKRR